MGHYPAWPGSQSYLRVACIFQHSSSNPPGDMVSSTYTIHDFSNVVYHSGAARTVTTTAITRLVRRRSRRRLHVDDRVGEPQDRTPLLVGGLAKQNL